VPLAAATYLKSASVFGFHGVYRRLADAVGVLDEGGLRELGEELLEVWAAEQALPGFNRTGQGAGERLRRDLTAAVADGLARGEVARGPRWGGWRFFFDHLRPFGAGRRERKLLWRALVTPEDDARAQVLKFLTSDRGRDALREADRDGDHSARYPHPIAPTELAGLDAVKTASRNVRRAFEHAEAQLEPARQDQTFRETFGPLTEATNPAAFVDALLDHHRQTQRRKPPDG